jgi:hypothetical protein
MLIVLRRLLVILALMFWQGGFTFYASVVVPIGQKELTDSIQGQITRQVTTYINLAGVAALPLLAWDIAAARDASAARKAIRWLSWLVMAGTLGYLFWSHDYLGDLLDRDHFERSLFRAHHRIYLWVSTAQWAAGLLFLLSTLRAWARETC